MSWVRVLQRAAVPGLFPDTREGLLCACFWGWGLRWVVERDRLPELKGRKWGTQNKVCSYGPGWHLPLLLQAPLTLRSVGCLWLPPTHLQCSP